MMIDLLRKTIIPMINRLYLAKYELTKRTYYFKRRVGCKIFRTEYYDKTLKPFQYKQELKKWYYIVTRQKLDLKNPITYNEKIQWFKLYGVSPYITMLCDKVAVRSWVGKTIGEQYLIPLVGTWNSFEEIDFSLLPDKFVLKCNHGAGYNEIVYDKDKIDLQELKKKFDIWINTNYAFIGGLELQYKDIKPQILAEEYLENVDGDLFDYKFWCFGGKVEFIMFLSERNKNLCMNNYDINWKLLPFTYGGCKNSEKTIERPKNLDEMVALAEKLSQGFPHVRVDLYLCNDGSIKFGEMTFTSFGGIMRWNDKNVDTWLGSLIDLKEYLQIGK